MSISKCYWITSSGDKIFDFRLDKYDSIDRLDLVYWTGPTRAKNTWIVYHADKTISHTPYEIFDAFLTAMLEEMDFDSKLYLYTKLDISGQMTTCRKDMSSDYYTILQLIFDYPLSAISHLDGWFGMIIKMMPDRKLPDDVGVGASGYKVIATDDELEKRMFLSAHSAGKTAKFAEMYGASTATIAKILGNK